VIATLHHVDAARRYADRVLGLSQGRLVFDGSAAELTDVVVGRVLGAPPAALATADETLPLGAGAGAAAPRLAVAS
jgi:phosphonate transport system ATP-binding protein